MFITSLPNTLVAGLLGNKVDDEDHDESDDGFEHARCGREGVVCLLDTDTVHIRIDDIGYVINQCGIQHEDLVEACVYDVVAVEDQHDNNRRGNRRQRDVDHLLPLACTVNLGCFVKLRVNTGQRREVNNRAPAHRLIDVGDNQHRDEERLVGKHLQVLARDALDG